jgi:hypothetical protein
MQNAENIHDRVVDSENRRYTCGFRPREDVELQKGNSALSGASGQRSGIDESDWIAFSKPSNHRKPVSRACSEISHSNMAMESTRKTMLQAQFFKKFCCWPSTAALDVLITLANRFHRFLVLRSGLMGNISIKFGRCFTLANYGTAFWRINGVFCRTDLGQQNFPFGASMNEGRAIRREF